MTRCDHCQSLLLDHLYGLLDPAEAAGVEEHLAGCPACATARGRAARAQHLFARAAKTGFPHVCFSPPVDGAAPAPTDANGRPVGPTVPSIAPVRSGFTRRGVWVWWAVAASVLALIPGVLLPLSKQSARYESAKGDAAAAATRLADAKAAVERAEGGAKQQADERYAAAKRQHDAVLAEWAAAEQAEKDRKVAVAVTRPEAAQPGAPNEFVVAVKDEANALRGRRVEAQVRDQAGKVLLAEKIDPQHPRGDTVRLPAGVWSHLTPQSELYLAVAAVDEQTGTRTDIQEPIRLFGPVYATMLVTDKANYRPGERLYFRSLTLDRVAFRSPAREQRLRYSLRKQDGPAVPDAALTGTTGLVRVRDGTVEPVVDHDGRPVRGVGCGAFVLPTDLADGDYTLTLTELGGPAGLPPVIKSPVSRTVRVRSGKPERFQKKIGFQAGSFAPGSQVAARAELKLGDKPVAGATAKVAFTTEAAVPSVVMVEPKAKDPAGKVIPSTGVTDEQGRVQIKATLPPNLPRGDVKLMVTFQTDGVEESVAERVPITGKDAIVEFFPEGGNLVAGVPNRVYVRGTTPAGKPVDLRGVVVAGKVEVARVETPTDANEPGVNRGLGTFAFTPKAGTAYRLKLHSSAFDLPPVQSEGVVMTVLDPVTGPGQPVGVRLYSVGKPRKLVVGAYTRGRLADTQTVATEPGKPAEVKLLAGGDERGGVTRITVFEQPADPKADLIPVAERLVFRKPGEVLNLSVSAGAPGTVFAPGSPVDLSVAATDEKGNPVPAILWAAAVNTAAAPGAKDRSLPTHFLLAGEIETPDDLEHADFLLTDHPEAATALDRVLATQGWRRFVEQAGPAAVAKLPPGPRADSANRLLAMAGQRSLTAGSRGAIVEKFWHRYEKAEGEFEAAQRAKAAAIRADEPAMQQLLAVYEERRRETADMTAAVRSAAEPLLAVRGWLGAAAGGLGLVAVVLGLGTVVRWNGLRGGLPLIVAAGGAGGLAIILALQASDRPVIPEVATDVAPPAVAPSAPIPAPRFENAQPVPPDSPGPADNGALVKGATTQHEPGATAALRGPKPLIAHRGGPKTPPPGTARPTIPDHMFWHGVIGPGGPVRDLTAIREADRVAAEKAAAFADRHAAERSAQIDAAFGPGKPGIDPAALERIRQAVLRTPPLVVREYAAPRPASGDPAAAGDTILWQPVIVLPTDGRTKLSFHLGSAPGGYQVVVAGHTPDGRLGTVRTVLPVAPVPSK